MQAGNQQPPHLSGPAYFRPVSLAQALGALGSAGIDVLAGGTDYYAARVGKPLTAPLLDITAIPELQGVGPAEGGWRIGAGATWSDVVAADLPSLFDGLKACALKVGGIQVQNRGTVGGNLCNASPAADGIPALLALDANVRLVSAAGERVMPLEDFILGPRRTLRQPGELLTDILIPARADTARARSVFLKHGHRSYLVISIAMVALTVEFDAQGRISHACAAIGSCAARAVRLDAVSQTLLGKPRDPALADALVEEHLQGIAPIDDVRGTASYRRDAALTLVRRAVREALS